MALMSDLDMNVPINNCTFRSIYGMVEKIKDCGSTGCPHSDNYVPPTK
jgi:hypothetical protein